MPHKEDLHFLRQISTQRSLQDRSGNDDTKPCDSRWNDWDKSLQALEAEIKSKEDASVTKKEEINALNAKLSERKDFLLKIKEACSKGGELEEIAYNYYLKVGGRQLEPQLTQKENTDIAAGSGLNLQKLKAHVDERTGDLIVENNDNNTLLSEPFRIPFPDGKHMKQGKAPGH